MSKNEDKKKNKNKNNKKKKDKKDIIEILKKVMKINKKILANIVFIAIPLLIIALFGPSFANKITGKDVVTSSRLEKAINIDNLSTAEFIYNGIAEKRKEKKPEKVEYYISYNATVKVGINMEDVKFDIDKKNKTVKPILPEIKVNIATPDEESFSYIPQNPDMSMKDIITLCKEDAINEANNSELLYQTAEENLQSVIEALLSPILESSGYTIVW